MITSRGNARLKEIRQLKQTKFRTREGKYFVEGVRLVEEALGHTGQVRTMVYSPRLEKNPRGASLLSTARNILPHAEWLYVSDEVMGMVCDTHSHQGILAVLEKRGYLLDEIWKREGLILLLHMLQDPGNLGTIFRAAEAGGAAGLILSRGSTDPYSPKVARASMGSLFRVPFLMDQDLTECLQKLRLRGFRLWAAAVQSELSFWEVDFSVRSAVLLGQEGAGLPKDLMEATDGVFTIPMTAGVDSLNVALAAGMVVYESYRQKKGRNSTANFF